MKAKTDERKSLNCTIEPSTMYAIAKAIAHMDETVKKITDKYQDIQRQIRRLAREAESLKESLALIGFRPQYIGEILSGAPGKDEQYADSLPFKHSTLVQSCKQVLRDHSPDWLTKTQVEYLVSMGGFQFSTSARKNSVAVTLRRLGENGYCEVQHDLNENKYQFKPKAGEPRFNT